MVEVVYQKNSLKTPGYRLNNTFRLYLVSEQKIPVFVQALFRKKVLVLRYRKNLGSKEVFFFFPLKAESRIRIEHPTPSVTAVKVKNGRYEYA